MNDGWNEPCLIEWAEALEETGMQDDAETAQAIRGALHEIANLKPYKTARDEVAKACGELGADEGTSLAGFVRKLGAERDAALARAVAAENKQQRTMRLAQSAYQRLKDRAEAAEARLAELEAAARGHLRAERTGGGCDIETTARLAAKLEAAHDALDALLRPATPEPKPCATCGGSRKVTRTGDPAAPRAQENLLMDCPDCRGGAEAGA